MMELLAKDERRILITFSHDEENRLKRQFPQFSNRIVDWKSYVAARKSGRGFFGNSPLNPQKLIVDNADYILESVLENYVENASFTKEVIDIRDATAAIGSIKTPKKSASSRKNGKKGGRPKSVKERFNLEKE